LFRFSTLIVPVLIIAWIKFTSSVWLIDNSGTVWIVGGWSINYWPAQNIWRGGQRYNPIGFQNLTCICDYVYSCFTNPEVVDIGSVAVGKELGGGTNLMMGGLLNDWGVLSGDPGVADDVDWSAASDINDFRIYTTLIRYKSEL
jgi:hypothetical protein